MKYKDLIKKISKTSGVGQKTVERTLAEYKAKGIVSSPNKIKIRKTAMDKTEDFDQNAIRQKNSALIERNDIVCWRRKYLESINYYRLSGRPIYYLDETWVNAGETSTKSWVDTTISSPRVAFLRGLTTGQKEPSGKSKRLIVLHIGSSDGFVPGALLCFESKKNTSDYHDEMNGDTFYDWFIKILPSLKENAVIVMDNASYHSVKKNRFPTMAWNKQEIKDWLENEGHIAQPELLKSQLLELVNQFKPLSDTYVIDEIAKENNKIVLRLPPYHCELNPIVLAWSWIKHYVRMHNTTFKLQDVHNLLKDAVEHVTSEMWTSFIGHVIKEEDKFLRVDHLSDEVFDAETGEHTLTITGDTTSDSDYENI
ncbi:uncharacterized protein LOC112599971 [Melanaphis sacchari]|uniref:uncharacterized protein LOC112599971 n=1 Tax=Melanaphis sacchari TaxID=742174 RepID=UPI000DC14320|nr:uncharacterized protein LOC112599971 [Melanaphis sacchari]